MKIISKVLSTRIKIVSPFLPSSNQTMTVKNRFINERGRVISDILETSISLALERFLVTVEIGEAFNSVNHCFLLHILQKFCFGIDFVGWIKMILNNEESCIINGGKTKYFKLERGTNQGDLISAYLFILFLEIFSIFIKCNPKVKGLNIFKHEIFFIFVKNNPKVKGLNIFKHEFLYTVYADDTTFFHKDRKSITELINELNAFSKFSRLKPNMTKFEIVSIGVQNGVQVALFGMKCVNLNNKTKKILGVQFSYNISYNLEQDENFCKHIKIYPHGTVNLRRKNFGLQILSCF